MKIQLLHSTENGHVPEISKLSLGELAINTADKVIYTLDSSSDKLFEINESVFMKSGNGFTNKNQSNTVLGKESVNSQCIAIGRNNKVDGENAIAIGGANEVSGHTAAFGIGYGVKSIGQGCFAEGWHTEASGFASHAEGHNTFATGARSHAEGSGTTASNNCCHAEGRETIAASVYSHAEGNKTSTYGSASHVEGTTNTIQNVEGTDEFIIRQAEYSPNGSTKIFTIKIGGVAVSNTLQMSPSAVTTDYRSGWVIKDTVTDKRYEVGALSATTDDRGYEVITINPKVLEGNITKDYATGNTFFIYNDIVGSKLECIYKIDTVNNMVYDYEKDQYGNHQNGSYAHVEGSDNYATGLSSHVEGWYNKGLYAGCHVEGKNNIAQAKNSHVEGYNNVADPLSEHTHVEGRDNTGSSTCSHVEGYRNQCYGFATHVGGNSSVVDGSYSFVHGVNAETKNPTEVAFGYYNKSTTDENDTNNWFAHNRYTNRTLFSIGNGSSASSDEESNEPSRHNAFEVKTSGDIYICDPNDIINKNRTDGSTCYNYNRYTVNLQDLLRLLSNGIEVTYHLSSENAISDADAKTVVEYLESNPSNYKNIIIKRSDSNNTIQASVTHSTLSASGTTRVLSGTIRLGTDDINYFEIILTKGSNGVWTASPFKTLPIVTSAVY